MGRAAERPPEVSFGVLEGVRAWFAGDASGVRGRRDMRAREKGEEAQRGLKEKDKNTFDEAAPLPVSRTRKRAPLYFFRQRERDNSGQANMQEETGIECKGDETQRVTGGAVFFTYLASSFRFFASSSSLME